MTDMEATLPCAAFLENPVQQYAWGRTEGIAPFIEIPPLNGLPAGEVWMGSHHRAPSKAIFDKGAVPLDELIRAAPEYWLGSKAARHYGDLPFLFKVLAAGAPLSLQLHPDAKAAKEGFAKEEAAGIPLLAPDRSFKDPNHKPELAVALTPFKALAGFRPLDHIAQFLGPELCRALSWNSIARTEDLRLFMRRLFEARGAGFMPLENMLESRAQALAASAASEEREAGLLALDLKARYPGDPGQFAPFIFNILSLEPGEGLFVPAGVIHAYLTGSILEIMACSDNVIRAGLTIKHIDIELLCDILDPDAKPLVVEPYITHAEGVEHAVWNTPADEFRLERLDLDSSANFAYAPEGPEILLCTQGKAHIQAGSAFDLKARSSLFVAGSCEQVAVKGPATVWRAIGPAPKAADAAGNSLTIWVDGDSLPRDLRPLLVKRALSPRKYGEVLVNVHFVAARALSGVPAHCMTLVEPGEGAADRCIESLAQPGDIVITRDIPFAERLLAKNIHVINDRGNVFTRDSIAERRSIRDVMAELRAVGIAQSSPKGSQRTSAETKRFADALERTIVKAARLKKAAAR
jgi:mannose-6-phosphate isomerase